MQLAPLWTISREKAMTESLWITNAFLLVRQTGMETRTFLDYTVSSL